MDVSLAGRHSVVLGVVPRKYAERTFFVCPTTDGLATKDQEEKDVVSGVYRDSRASHGLHSRVASGGM